MLDALSSDERSELLQSVGTHKTKRKVSPIKVAKHLKKATSAQTLDQIADDLELRDASMLNRFLALLELPAEIRDLVAWGSQAGYISFSTAVEIARLQDQDACLALGKAALEHTLSKEEVQAVVQRVRRGQVDIHLALREILEMRPVVERQYMFVGAIKNRKPGDDAEFRRDLRVALAKRFGAENVLSVSANSGKFTFLLTERAATTSEYAPRLAADKVEPFVAEIVQDVR